MGSDKDKSCGGKLCCYVNTFGLLFVAGTIAWYFIYFAKDIESLVGDCGGCYCIPDKSTSFECPSKSTEAPPMSYPEETHLNAWKSQTILNPYLLNCNPYEDGVFCDTEPSSIPISNGSSSAKPPFAPSTTNRKSHNREDLRNNKPKSRSTQTQAQTQTQTKSKTSRTSKKTTILLMKVMHAKTIYTIA